MSGEQPKALQNQPALTFGEGYYFDIFNKVSRYRQFTTAGPLPLAIESVLLSYCTFYGIHDVEQRESIAKAVEALDNEYLDNAMKKVEKGA